MTTQTEWMLLARYQGMPIVPVDDVCRDFFRHLTPQKLLRNVQDGKLNLPIVGMAESQKAAKGVYLSDLAAYLDARREEALRDNAAVYR